MINYEVWRSYCTHRWAPAYKGMSIARDTGSTSAWYVIWRCVSCGVWEIRPG